MPRTLAEMLAAVGAVPPGRAVAARLPLVHRAAKPPRSWRDILATGLLSGEPGTDCERAKGHTKAVYFFLGCGPYPQAKYVAFFYPAELLAGREATATPFDSGACCAGFLDRKGAPIGLAERCDVLDAHTLTPASDVVAFGDPYLWSLFDDAARYITHPQKSSPDRPPYHGLTARDGDRRAWTIEVQCYDDVPATTAEVEMVIVADRDVWQDLPLPFAARAMVADPARSTSGDVLGESIASAIHRRVKGVAP